MSAMKALFNADSQIGYAWMELREAAKNEPDAERAERLRAIVEATEKLNELISDELNAMFDSEEEYLDALVVALRGGDPAEEIRIAVKEAV